MQIMPLWRALVCYALFDTYRWRGITINAVEGQCGYLHPLNIKICTLNIFNSDFWLGESAFRATLKAKWFSYLPLRLGFKEERTVIIMFSNLTKEQIEASLQKGELQKQSDTEIY